MPEAAIQRAAPEATGTVALLYQQFHDVLVPLEAVRLRYFRNRNGETFRLALRDGDIPLPVVTLDDSHKSPRFICLYQLAAYIEHRARDAALERPGLEQEHASLNRALFDAVPKTASQSATAAEPPAQPGHHHEKGARP